MPTNPKNSPAAPAPANMIVQARNQHPESEGFLSELIERAQAAQTYARGASQTLDAVANGEAAFPDPQATAEAVIALAGQVNTLASCVFELARLVRHDDIRSLSKGLPH